MQKEDIDILQKAYALIQDAYCLEEEIHDAYIKHICRQFRDLIDRIKKDSNV